MFQIQFSNMLNKPDLYNGRHFNSCIKADYQCNALSIVVYGVDKMGFDTVHLNESKYLITLRSDYNIVVALKKKENNRCTTKQCLSICCLLKYTSLVWQMQQNWIIFICTVHSRFVFVNVNPDWNPSAILKRAEWKILWQENECKESKCGVTLIRSKEFKR